MTRRYIVKPRADHWSEDKPFLPALQVFERDTSPRNTGLLDHLGNELYAVERLRPIGFTAAGDDP